MKPRRFREKVTSCAEHGEHRWGFSIACSACGRVYQIRDARMPHFAGLRCHCGASLDSLRAGSHAVALCFACFLDACSAPREDGEQPHVELDAPGEAASS